MSQIIFEIIEEEKIEMENPTLIVSNNISIKQLKEKSPLDCISKMETTNIQTPLTLNMSSTMKSFTMLELIPKNRIRALMRSPEFPTQFEEHSYNLSTAKYNKIENPKDQLEKYIKKYNPDMEGVPIEYKKAKSGYGRAYADKGIGLTPIKRSLRNTLIDGLYIDFDIENCQFSIMNHLLQKVGLPNQAINDFCINRKHYFEELINATNLTKKEVKKLPLSLLFGADITKGFDSWCYKYKQNIAKPEWIKNIENELPAFVEEVKKANSALWNFAYDKTRKDTSKDAKKKTKQNTYGTFLSTYLQEMEFQLVSTCMERLATTTTLFKHPNSKRKERVGSYEYDGFKVLTANCEGIDVLGMLHQFSAEFGLPVEWAQKELDDIIDISKELEEVAVEMSPDEELASVITKILSLDTDTAIVNFVAEHFPKQFVWNEKEKEWYCWNGEKWQKGDRIFRLTLCDKVYPIVLGLLEPYAERFQDENEDDPNYKNYNSAMKFCHQVLRKRLQNQLDHNALSGMAKTKYGENVEFNTNRMLLGFTNGVYDFNEEVFRPYRYSDYMTMNVGYPLEMTYGLKIVNEKGEIYRNKEEWSEADNALLAELSDVLDKIFPDVAVQELALQIMSTGLVGIAMEYLIIWNGGGRNGKGMINEFLKVVLGDYMIWGDKMILSEVKKETGNANPALAEISKMRYVVMKEPPEDRPINNATYKDLTGGGEFKARTLYSTDNSVHLFLTMILECNQKPPLLHKPSAADSQRIIDIPFVSTFVVGGTEDPVDEANHRYQRNPSLKNMDWKKKMAQPMMLLLISNCLEMKKRNWIFDKPQSVIDRGLQYCLDSTPEHNILKELFEVRNPNSNYEDDRDVTIKQIWLAFKQRIDFTADKAEKKTLKKITQASLMEFLNATNPYKNDFYNNSSRHTYCLRNWRKKPDEDDALDEDDH